MATIITPEECTEIVIYTVFFVFLSFVIICSSRALVQTAWPIYVLSGVIAVQILRMFSPRDVWEDLKHYFDLAFDSASKQIQRLSAAIAGK